MHSEIESRKEEIAEICRRHGVKRPDLFGSAARGTNFDPKSSGADFLVGFQRPLPREMPNCLMGLKHDLADVPGRDVDLGSTNVIRNKWLKAHIDSSRETVLDCAA